MAHDYLFAVQITKREKKKEEENRKKTALNYIMAITFGECRI